MVFQRRAARALVLAWGCAHPFPGWAVPGAGRWSPSSPGMRRVVSPFFLLCFLAVSIRDSPWGSCPHGPYFLLCRFSFPATARDWNIQIPGFPVILISGFQSTWRVMWTPRLVQYRQGWPPLWPHLPCLEHCWMSAFAALSFVGSFITSCSFRSRAWHVVPGLPARPRSALRSGRPAGRRCTARRHGEW